MITKLKELRKYMEIEKVISNILDSFKIFLNNLIYPHVNVLQLNSFTMIPVSTNALHKLNIPEKRLVLEPSKIMNISMKTYLLPLNAISILIRSNVYLNAKLQWT